MSYFQKILFALLYVIQISIAKEWWEGANYYQIYPKSFKDSNGDGYGDLQGIRSKVPYLKDIGMDAVWLSPCFTSPQRDGGYDISNYTEIDPIFGTLNDFDQLVQTCKDNGVHLILDFVPNHTSNDSIWFQKSALRDEYYENFYVWQAGIPNPDDPQGRPLPPNNWISIFRFSAWEWNDVRGEYYLHQFVPGQPDLNYREPKVVKEMKDVLRFWLRRGVSGFRIDTIPNLFEYRNADGTYPDEPLSGGCDDPDSSCYLNHIYTANQPETMDMAYQWHQVLEEFRQDEPRILMTEAYTTLDIIVEYYGNATHNGSQVPFNFEVLTKLNTQSTAKQLKIIAENYLNYIPSNRGFYPNWVLGNHDNHRLATRLGPSRADLYNIFLQTMPGNAVTYQGEELCMPNVVVPWEETQDPQACNTNSTVYHQYSRDPARTPFPWDSTANAGFTNGTPWITAGTEFPNYNVQKQLSDESSHLKIFKKLTQLHKSPAFSQGLYESTNGINDNIFSYIRSHGDDVYLVALNFGKTEQSGNFVSGYRALGSTGEVVVATLGSSLKEGQQVQLNSLRIPADNGVVIKVNIETSSSNGITMEVRIWVLLLLTIATLVFM